MSYMENKASDQIDAGLSERDELLAKLQKYEENMVAIATVFVHSSTMRLEARKCLSSIDPKRFPLNDPWPKNRSK